MGEVLAGTVILIAVISLLVGALTALSKSNKANAPETQQPEYRNHLAMARWIEHAMDDDMERVVIPEERQQAARRLLAAFYNEKEPK